VSKSTLCISHISGQKQIFKMIPLSLPPKPKNCLTTIIVIEVCV